MWRDLWNNINNSFNDITMDIKEFFIEHCRNPFLWIGIIILALVIFESVYRSLHRD